MPFFIVLLRGVNVGKANRVPMAEFLENLGYSHVSTLLNSGNAVFASTDPSTVKHAASIAATLQKTLNITVPVIVKSAVELSEAISASPIDPSETDHSKFLVAFAADSDAIRALAVLQELAEPPERFVVTKTAAYLHCPAGVLQSRVGKALLGKAGDRVTTRNWATVMKLLALASASFKLP
jgi:uncharacterized protein (DUF1697 family)